jgi:RNA polymerase sigma-70 factor (sigma-E family)
MQRAGSPWRRPRVSVDTASLELPWLVGRGRQPAGRPARVPAVTGSDLPARAAVATGGPARVATVDAAVSAAFSRYAAERGPGLVRLARGLLRDPHQAEDVVQDVLAKVLLQWGRVSAADDMNAYVHRMVVNACTSFFRRAAHRREFAYGPLTMPDRPTADPTGAVDDADRLVGLLRRLPAKQRAVLVLRHYEGMPDAQIAGILGTTEVTVRSNAHRGLASLRRMIEADGVAAAPAAGGPEESR